MRSLIFLFTFGIILTVSCFSQTKSDKSCCSDGDKSSLSSSCTDADQVSISSDESEDLLASVQDDKDKKSDNKMKEKDKSLKKDKSKTKMHDDDCCMPDKKKTEKNKSPKS